MMIHKIEPHKYYPEFRDQEPKPSDYLLLFDGEKVYLPSHTENSDVTDTSASAGISEHPQVYLPTFEEVHGLLGIRQPMERFFLDCEYLFSIDDRAFFRKTTEDAGALMLPEEDLYASGMFRNFEPEYLAFAGETFAGDALEKYAGRECRYLKFGEQLYRIPEGMPSVKGLKVLRPGLHLGTAKKGRFEPSHALALTLHAADVLHTMDLPSDGREIRGYLNGETFPAQGEKGWYLITVDGYSTGWGKLAGGIMKNHYPKGLRKLL